jgi:hypothetical protein
MSHALALVVIFVHLCEMYMSVRLSVHLFQLFFVLRDSGRSATHLGAYYFQHRSKPTSTYIAPLSPDKWDRWRDDWVIVQADAYDQLELPTSEPTGNWSSWEKVPDLQSTYHPVLKRI